MGRIEKWQLGAVVQRDKELGCIPTGIEWMIRVSGISNVPLNDFQEMYNLQRNGIALNSFETVSRYINHDYPQVKIRYRIFDQGAEKAKFINALLEKGIPSILSLCLTPRGGWHIMPVIELINGKFRLLNYVTEGGLIDICEISEQELVRRHDEWPGGNDVAWLGHEDQ